MSATSTVAQTICDPLLAPSNLQSVYVEGSGATLTWNAIPGSIGVRIRANTPSGTSVSRRIVGSSLDQYFVPDAVLEPGFYNWRVQAACSMAPPFDLTPISDADTFLVGSAVSCPSTVSDIDGNVYPVVQIGDQCWMAENLKVKRYNNGDSIPFGLNHDQWNDTEEGAIAVYADSFAYLYIYAPLYNGFSVDDPRGICPVGWHVPTDLEWTKLVLLFDPFVCGGCAGSGYSNSGGGPLKTIGNLTDGSGLWRSPNAGATNSSGFNGLPGGTRHNSGFYDYLGERGIWWSSTGTSGETIWSRRLTYGGPGIARIEVYRKSGVSVRCIQDD